MITFQDYITDKGISPVREFLRKLPIKDYAFIQAKLDWAQKSDQFTRDFYTKFKNMNLDLGEVRPGNYRIIILRASSNIFILLHAFRKKTNETHQREIKIAYNHAIDYLRRNQFQ